MASLPAKATSLENQKSAGPSAVPAVPPKGETVRKLMDCFIAAVALRAGAPVLHKDVDFDVLARHTDLRIAS